MASSEREYQKSRQVLAALRASPPKDRHMLRRLAKLEQAMAAAEALRERLLAAEIALVGLRVAREKADAAAWIEARALISGVRATPTGENSPELRMMGYKTRLEKAKTGPKKRSA